MRTRRELCTDVLEELRMVTTGLPPSANNLATVRDHYEEVHAQLVDRGLCYWTNTDDTTAEIPLAIYRPLVNIVTAEVAGNFGKDEPVAFDENGEKVAAGVKGWRDLRRHMAKRPSGEPTPFSPY